MDYVLFWIAKPIGEFLGGLLLIALILGPFVLRSVWKQWRCKHVHYYENSACNAICRDCGVNLGFIGKLAKSKPEGA